MLYLVTSQKKRVSHQDSTTRLRSLQSADKKEVFEDYKKGHLPIVDIVQLPLSKKMSSCLNQLERLTPEL